MTQPAEESVNQSAIQPAELPAPLATETSHSSQSDSSACCAPSPQSKLVAGAVLLLGGALLWIFGAELGIAQPGLQAVAALGAVAVIVFAFYSGVVGATRRVGFNRDAGVSRETVFGLLPLGGLVLVGLGGLVPLVLGDTEFHPQGSAAPILLAGIYLLTRGFAARGWIKTGVYEPVFFPSLATLQGGDINSIVQGATLKLQAGSVVPVDVRISSGSVGVQERYLSPLTSFRVKDETEVLYAGSLVTGGSAEVVALTDSASSCLRRLEAGVREQLAEAQSALLVRDEPTARLVAYALLFCSVSAAIFWNERGVSPAVVLEAAGLVLFAATLGLVADHVYLSFTGLVRGWARRGFVLLGAESFDVLAQIKKVVFAPEVVFSPSICRVKELEILDDRINREALCSTLSSFLGRADDVGFAALGNYCAVVSPSANPERVLDLREYASVGVCGAIKGIEFSIGSEGFLVERGIMMQPSDGTASVAPNERVLLVAIDSDVIARCILSYGQQGLVSEEEGEGTWDDADDTVATVASPEQGEFGDGTLIVGQVDSLSGSGSARTHRVVPLSVGSLRPPRATVLSLTQDYSALSELLRDCREHLKWAGLCRALVAAGGIIAVTAVFAGFTSVWVPLVLVPLVTVLLFL
jgi:hypothetical protein